MRGIAAGFGILSLALLAGCPGKQTTPKKSEPAPVDSDATGLDALLGDNCRVCHGKSRSPSLETPLDRDTAVRAAILVGAGKMPPGDDLESGDREKIVAGLCSIGSDPTSLERCVQIVSDVGPEFDIQPAQDWLLQIDELAPLEEPSERASRIQGGMSRTFRFDAARMKAESTYQILRTLWAEERCHTLHGEDAQKYDTCLAELLDADLAATPDRGEFAR